MEKQREINQSAKWHKLILHLHPKYVPVKALKFNLTFGLGGMAALLFVLQLATGILLKFTYVPTPTDAYDSILFIKQELVFGNLVRNIHYWSGMLLVLITFLHLLRVLLTGAYANDRKWNWVVGVFLLILVLFSNFTGYLLPWDQLSYWAITVSTSMLEYIPLIGGQLNQFIVRGDEIGDSTLLFFYVLHTGLLPTTIVILMSLHFWKVRKNGGVAIPLSDANEQPEKVKVIPNLVMREFTVALILIAFLMLLSTFFDATLGDRANIAITPNPTKAPWYFMGFQELLLHFHPVISVVIMPIALTFLLFYLPWIKNNTPNHGVWFLSPKGKKLAISGFLSGLIFTSIYIILDDYVLDTLEFFTGGIVPFIVFLCVIVGKVFWMWKKSKANRPEIIQAISVFIITGFIVMTIFGIYFRGEGMELGFNF